jgi:hypothetical protein
MTKRRADKAKKGGCQIGGKKILIFCPAGVNLCDTGAFSNEKTERHRRQKNEKPA